MRRYRGRKFSLRFLGDGSDFRRQETRREEREGEEREGEKAEERGKKRRREKEKDRGEGSGKREKKTPLTTEAISVARREESGRREEFLDREKERENTRERRGRKESPPPLTHARARVGERGRRGKEGEDRRKKGRRRKERKEKRKRGGEEFLFLSPLLATEIPVSERKRNSTIRRSRQTSTSRERL